MNLFAKERETDRYSKKKNKKKNQHMDTKGERRVQRIDKLGVSS